MIDTILDHAVIGLVLAGLVVIVAEAIRERRR